MTVILTGVLIAVTAILLIGCSPELETSPAQVTSRDRPTANTTATSSATPTTQPTNTPAQSAPPSPADLQITIAPVPGNLPAYNRYDWKHWTDADGDCQDARQEVLVAESLATPSFKSDRRCRVTSGQWLAPFTGTVVTDPGKLDIDHMVPLGNAHRSGAWEWTAERKRLYANYLADPQHLIAVTASANRSKGARGPEDWKPDDRSYWCQYAVDWLTIKDDWDLTVTLREIDAITGMLDTCANPPNLLLSDGDAPIVPRPTNGPHYPTDTPTATTYSSCDDARAAGQARVQGAKGSGQGFPKSVVPSARDGDADGIFCEK